MKIFSLVFLLFLSACSGKWRYVEGASSKSWGDLDEKFKFCKIGYNQSPIDVKLPFEINDDLKFSYQNSDVAKQREDYVLSFDFFSKDKNILLRGKKKYFLRKFHFHHPSEHLIGSKPHSLELQIYHKSEDEQWLVLAIFLEVGQKNSEFQKIVELISAKKSEGKIDLKNIVKSDDKIFYYDGSFTTPPCKEGVKWYVMKTPISISKEQMNAIIKGAIFTKSNAREVQEFHPEKF